MFSPHISAQSIRPLHFLNSLSGLNPSIPLSTFLPPFHPPSPPSLSLPPTHLPLPAHTATGPELLARHRSSSLAASSSLRDLTKCCNHKKEAKTEVV